MVLDGFADDKASDVKKENKSSDTETAPVRKLSAIVMTSQRDALCCSGLSDMDKAMC